MPPGCIELKAFLRKQTADLMYTPNQDFIAFIETVRKEATRLMKDEEFRSEKIHSATKKNIQTKNTNISEKKHGC